MTELNQDTAVRKLGSGSGVGGDGLITEFEFPKPTIITSEYGSVRQIDASLKSARFTINNRPALLHLLHQVYESLKEAEANNLKCEPCVLTIEVTFGDQTVRLATELHKTN